MEEISRFQLLNSSVSADDGVQLTAVQLQLIKEAHSPPKPKDVQEANVAVARDAELRRAVYDTIVQLSEIVSENALKCLLPFLHCGAWDEVVEERYLGNPHMCGFPLCGEVVEAKMRKQRYHIDRIACKIYEHRIETDMYCSRSCLMRSASVRSQLPDEPLWLSGNIAKRLTSVYHIEGPLELDRERKEIEIVCAVEEKLSELKIREGGSSTESETEDNDESETCRNSMPEQFQDIKGLLDEPSYNPRLPDPQMSDNIAFTDDELEKLARLRSKYSKNWGKKKPIIVDPVPASPSSSKEEIIYADFKVSEEKEVDTAKHSPKAAIPTRSCLEPKFVESVRTLFRMTTYQEELGVSFSETNWLYMIAATFDLEPNTITDFPNRVLKLVCCILLKLISSVDTSVEDIIYLGGNASDKFVQLLAEIDVDVKTFESIVSEIVTDEKKPE
ncbi:unnamed protein product [Strongylus vulgaris]|uniref:RNA polymerase II subunit B1 CTD phosphatase RPAP2 homolog n=1 Tax=Strongylus vulgaris TaxID=40348 RepID=A0A3P7IS99_STRVU|nr:unnamed protein product [Strongylus vulgaris]